MRPTLLAAMVFLAGIARAAPSDLSAGPGLDLPLEGKTTDPDWRTRPSAEQISLVYPKFAALLSISGHARMTCSAEPDGSVDECSVTAESPKDLGFGPAALRLAPYFQMKPATLDGRPTRSSVDIPINFKMENAPAARPVSALPTVDSAKLAMAREVLSLAGAREGGLRGWRDWLDRLVAQAVESGDSPPSAEMREAIQASIEQVADEIMDRRAHDLALLASPEDLVTIRDFYKSPAGRFWISAWARAETKAEEETEGQRMVKLARDRLCAKVSCGG